MSPFSSSEETRRPARERDGNEDGRDNGLYNRRKLCKLWTEVQNHYEEAEGRREEIHATIKAIAGAKREIEFVMTEKG